MTQRTTISLVHSAYVHTSVSNHVVQSRLVVVAFKAVPVAPMFTSNHAFFLNME